MSSDNWEQRLDQRLREIDEHIARTLSDEPLPGSPTPMTSPGSEDALGFTPGPRHFAGLFAENQTAFFRADTSELAQVFAYQIFLMSAATSLIGGILGCGLAALVNYGLLALLPVLRMAVPSLAVFPVPHLVGGLGIVLLSATAWAWFFFRKILGTPVTDLLRR